MIASLRTNELLKEQLLRQKGNTNFFQNFCEF
jgi:hypothetical protein